MEHEARFERIEATLETLAKAQLRGEYALTDAVENMARSHKQLITAQVIMADAQTKAEQSMAKLADALAAIEAKHAEEHDDLKDKLHVLYDVVDRWIREHGGQNGTPKPPPAA